AGFGARAAEVAAELAGHFERGSEPTRAIPWLQSAAAAAQRRFAPREAAGYMRRALRLIENDPDGPERWRRELGPMSTLGIAVIATDGFAAQEAWHSLMRAQELARRVEDTGALFRITYMLLNASLARGDLLHIPPLADEIGRAARQLDTEPARVVASML